MVRSGRLILAVVACLVASFGVDSRSSAQEGTVHELVLPAEALNVQLGESRTLREALGEVAVYANGQLCTIVDVKSGSGRVVIKLGLPGQPETCRIPGAKLSFLDGLHNQLNRRLTLGAENILADFTPAPPGIGATVIIVPKTSLATENENGTLGGWLGVLTAKVGETPCTSADVSAASRDVALPVGLPGQPSACTTAGAQIQIVDVRGFVLAEHFVFEPGAKVIMSNLAPLPPDQQPPLPAATPQPTGSTAPTESSGAIRPPSTGSGGLR